MGKVMPGQAYCETILQTGQIVGAQYRVDKLIAKGGMAAVWSGVNLHTGKHIALKVVLRSFASNGEAAELFHREALAASKINHPNVVSIFDVIDHEGMTCIVMELLDGETLGNYLARSGPLSLETTVALLLPAMRGVAAANAQGVVHRDLKPGNIFLCSGPDGRLLTTKVLDFGISVIMRRSGDTSIATEPLAMFGTPAYMAPEAIELSLNIDGRADVYGFGVLFFEALTGKLPFLGPPGQDLLRRVLTDPAPKVTLYRPDLPSVVVRIIDCALAKNANDRFPNMEHLIRATEDCLLTLPPTRDALTTISGLFPIPLAAANPSTMAPMVQAVDEKRPTGRAHLAETRVLYSLASEAPRAADKAGIAQRMSRRAAVGAAIVVFLIVMGWVTVPASSGDSGVGQDRSPSFSKIAAGARGPLVTPPPSHPAPAPSFASTADNSSHSIADSESARAMNAQLVPAQTHETPRIEKADKAATDASKPSIRASAPNSSRRIFHGWSAASRSHAADLSNQPSVPRAGTLSPSDF
jgi:serine/threonine-protein kinase